MFTGIVTAVGAVREARSADGGLELTIACPYPELIAGESIAVDGACLTAARVSGGEFTAHLVQTTLDRTGFAAYSVGRRVNLERALRVGDPLGGHLVQGHVDGVGSVIRVAQHADARLIDLEVPDGSHGQRDSGPRHDPDLSDSVYFRAHHPGRTPGGRPGPSGRGHDREVRGGDAERGMARRPG
jgi:riboflavin synthase alpha subunit